MTILSSELKFYKPRTVTDTDANGGRMSFNEIVSNTLQNTFPHAFSSERLAGSTKYRKLFLQVANDADETLYQALFRFFAPTAGDDYCCFWAGTPTDTQADIAGTERKYGVGTLNTAVSAGGSTLIVDVQNAAHATGNDAIFAGGDTILITDKASWDAGTGNIEEHTIDGTPSVSGTEVTITLTGQLANDYAAGTGTTVMSGLDSGDIATSFDNWDETGMAAGSYDEGSYPPVLDNLGTVDLEVTLTFTDATNFTATCDDPDITLGSGTTGSDFAPLNPWNAKPLFTLESGGWSGSEAAADELVFQVHGAYVGLWEKRVIPASCGPLTGNKLTLVSGGESV